MRLHRLVILWACIGFTLIGLAASPVQAAPIVPRLSVAAKSHTTPGVEYGTVNVAIECAALLHFPGTTSIDACYLLGDNGTRYDVRKPAVPLPPPYGFGLELDLAGSPANAKRDVFVGIRNEPLLACVEASATTDSPEAPHVSNSGCDVAFL